MVLPKNGRVMIIDDMADQAMPLIKAMSKYNISTTYFNGQVESLPEELSNDTRVIFLDINLNGEQQAHWENERGTIISTITSLIEEDIPYILFVWSVNEKRLVEGEGESTLFDKIIELFKKELIKYKPLIDPIPLGKDEIFNQELKGEGEDAKIIYSLNHDEKETITLINQKIENGIKNIDSIEALLKWEGIVDTSTALVVNDIFNLAKINGDLNSNLKQIYLNLAQGYWGKSLKGKDPREKVAKSLISLNSILIDKIESELKSLNVELLQDFPERTDSQSKVRAELNTRLLFTEDLYDEPLPGNLYMIQNDATKDDIVKSILDRSTFNIDYCIENNISLNDFYEGPQIREEHKKLSVSYGYRKEKEAVEQAIYFELEITPICDYSQDNRKFCRMISGVILNEKYRSKTKKSADFFYLSPVFLFEGTPVNFYCDLRYVQSKNIPELNNVMPILRIRHLFQSDIQSQLARQVSRPGIVSL